LPNTFSIKIRKIVFLFEPPDGDTLHYITLQLHYNYITIIIQTTIKLRTATESQAVIVFNSDVATTVNSTYLV
jgi:hypothetical protein